MVMDTIIHTVPVLLLLAILGCETSSSVTTTATGMVMADGEPLSGAVITLEPMGKTTGPNGSAPVFNGRFEIGNDAKLQGGTYRVRVSMLPTEILESMRRSGVSETPPPGRVVAPAFDTDSVLTCELTRGPNDALTFDISFLKANR